MQAVLHSPAGQTDGSSTGGIWTFPPFQALSKQGWYLRCLFFQEMVWKMVETMKRLDKPKP